MKKYFINDYITYFYPHESNDKVEEYGVLSKYIGKYYDRDEMDKIICEMIMRHPYIENAVMLSILVMRKEDNVGEIYYSFDFKNDNHTQQTKGNLEIKYENN